MSHLTLQQLQNQIVNESNQWINSIQQISSSVLLSTTPDSIQHTIHLLQSQLDTVLTLKGDMINYHSELASIQQSTYSIATRSNSSNNNQQQQQQQQQQELYSNPYQSEFKSDSIVVNESANSPIMNSNSTNISNNKSTRNNNNNRLSNNSTNNSNNNPRRMSISSTQSDNISDVESTDTATTVLNELEIESNIDSSTKNTTDTINNLVELFNSAVLVSIQQPLTNNNITDIKSNSKLIDELFESYQSNWSTEQQNQWFSKLTASYDNLTVYINNSNRFKLFGYYQRSVIIHRLFKSLPHGEFTIKFNQLMKNSTANNNPGATFKRSSDQSAYLNLYRVFNQLSIIQLPESAISGISIDSYVFAIDLNWTEWKLYTTVPATQSILHPAIQLFTDYQQRRIFVSELDWDDKLIFNQFNNSSNGVQVHYVGQFYIDELDSPIASLQQSVLNYINQLNHSTSNTGDTGNTTIFRTLCLFDLIFELTDPDYKYQDGDKYYTIHYIAGTITIEWSANSNEYNIINSSLFDPQRSSTGDYSTEADLNIWNRAFELFNTFIVNNSNRFSNNSSNSGRNSRRRNSNSNGGSNILSINHPTISCQSSSSTSYIDTDTFCQSWSLNYYFYRIIGLNHSQIIELYNNITISRLDFIKLFASNLLSDNHIQELQNEIEMNMNMD